MCIDFHGFSKVEEKDVKNVERACFFPRSYDTLLWIRGKSEKGGKSKNGRGKTGRDL